MKKSVSGEKLTLGGLYHQFSQILSLAFCSLNKEND